MPFIGNTPAQVPLTSADIADGIITSAKITDATIVNGDIANSTIALAKLSATGTPSAATFLRGDNAWGEAGAAAGQVIQVLGATDQTQRSTTSTSFVTASNTLSVTITPSSTSNKIFIICSGNFYCQGTAYFTFYRNGSTNLGNGNFGMNGYTSGGNSLSYLDSPSTTSSTTYQIYFRTNNSSDLAYLNYDTSKSSITAFEIKG